MLAAVLAADGPVNEVAPPDAVAGAQPQASPPPPEVVVLETYYGTVTLDHRAHLAMDAPCLACHDPGGVSKIEFTPKVAHDRCVGCHKEQGGGPVQCTGCHVKPPSAIPGVQLSPSQGGVVAVPVSAAAATTAAPAEPGAAKAAPSAGAPSSGAAAGGGAPPKAAQQATRGFQRVLHLGWSVGDGTGPTIRASSRQGSLAMTFSFDRLGGDHARTLGLIGAGVTRPLHERWRFEGIALGGFDLIENPRLDARPALGARAGLEWLTHRWLFESVQVSVTGIADVSRNVADGDIAGTVYGTVSTGLTLPAR